MVFEKNSRTKEEYRIIDSYESPGKVVRSIRNNDFGAQSAMYIIDGKPSDDLVYEYTKYFLLGSHFCTKINNALMVGGGAYSFPKKFLKVYPQASIDVVEVQPFFTEIAKLYFYLKKNPRMAIYHQEGRDFLEENKKIYDCIYIDAFGKTNKIPRQLTTVEAVEKMHQSLSGRGVVIMNIISALEGRAAGFLRNEYATFKRIFSQVYLFMVNDPFDADAAKDPELIDNFILVALKYGKIPKWESNDPELNSFLNTRWKGKINGGKILTDK